ncbi:MAG: hypothetical protein ACRD2A_00380 [Vicinamibacterales bacterium]
MSDRENQIRQLFTAELQFRLASAVRLAVTGNRQPLDLPIEWTHGSHHVRYEEIALRQDQADYAACFLHRSATYLMAVAVRDAIRAVVPDPKSSSDSTVRAAYQIARLIRNAFAHAPFSPTWSIDPDCLDQTFSVPDLIELNTTGLHGTAFDWRHYGGPLALLRLCRFVRSEILKDQSPVRKVVPIPTQRIYQQGDLVITKADHISPQAVPIEMELRPDGGIELGGGHVLYPQEKPGKM